MSENIREIVFDCLCETDERDKKSHLVMREVLDKYDYLDNSDKNFIKRLFEGTVQKEITLDYILNRFSTKPMDKCKPEIREILRMGAYQILYMDRVPDSAAVDEAVNLCNSRSRRELSGFVNAVLRKVSADKETVFSFDNIEDREERLSVKYSLPRWIVKMLVKEQKNPEELIEALNNPRPTVVRIIGGKNENKLLKEWADKGIEFIPSKRIPHVYEISGFHGMNEVPGFLEGLLYIQDESSMLAVREALKNHGADPKVLDLCAAPGGKSIYALELLEGRGHVTSLDVSPEKVRLIRDNISRLGFENVDYDVNDASYFREEFENRYDIVICDVPCSGLGVISRKSDIKYKISNEGMITLCALQKDIVANAVKYVKPGGVLLYSTCTIHKAENEKMAKYIVNQFGFEQVYEKQLLPNIDNTDGFYFAVLTKKSDFDEN